MWALWDVKEPLTLNRYNYCAGNPLYYVDRSGHWLFKAEREEIESYEFTYVELMDKRVSAGRALSFLSALHALNSPYATVDFVLNYDYRNSYFEYILEKATKENCMIDECGEISEGSLVLEYEFEYYWMKDELKSTPYVTQEFLSKMLGISSQLQVNPDDLMAVMAFESWLNPAAQNSWTNATGLIQFMPDTAKNLGTSIEDLAKMDGVEQLDYVYLHYAPYIGKVQDVSDAYMVTLWPAAVGKPSDYVLYEKGEKAYEQNKGLDYNDDGIITKEEATKKILDRRSLYE